MPSPTDEAGKNRRPSVETTEYVSRINRLDPQPARKSVEQINRANSPAGKSSDKASDKHGAY